MTFEELLKELKPYVLRWTKEGVITSSPVRGAVIPSPAIGLIEEAGPGLQEETGGQLKEES